MVKKGFEIIKKEGNDYIKSNKDEIVMQGEQHGLYIIHCTTGTPSTSSQPSKFAFSAHFDQSLDL